MSLDNFEIIHTYCRKQAIADGVLIDETDQAGSLIKKEVGLPTSFCRAIIDLLYG